MVADRLARMAPDLDVTSLLGIAPEAEATGS
jgi:hypothetical protein